MKPRIFLLGKGEWGCGIVRKPAAADMMDAQHVRWVLDYERSGLGRSPRQAYAAWVRYERFRSELLADVSGG